MDFVQKSTPVRQPKKRAGSPVSSPAVPKKGKMLNHHKVSTIRVYGGQG